jgi:hypothetical protein
MYYVHIEHIILLYYIITFFYQFMHNQYFGLHRKTKDT